MADTLDIKGFYRMLGVPPTAQPDEIRKAYRKLAVELHPDRNPGRDTTASFQKLSEAYNVLKDARKRAEYDAAGAAQTRQSTRGSTGTAEATATSTPRAPERAGPKIINGVHLCARCGRLSAQPRITFFMAVRGLIAVTRTIRKGGIYCPRCAMKLGLLNNALNWLFGWWALPFGPPRVIEATVTNMVGGTRPPDENVNLLYQQARGFMLAGHNRIAIGIIEDALRLAPTLAMRDQLLALRRQAGSSNPGARLKNEWRVLNNPLFYLQAAPLIVVTLLIVQTFISLVNVQMFDLSGIKRQFGGLMSGSVFSDMGLFGGNASNAKATIPHTVIQDELPIYEAPNLQSRQAGKLKQGIEVQIIPGGAAGGWAAIRFSEQRILYAPMSGLQPLPRVPVP